MKCRKLTEERGFSVKLNLLTTLFARLSADGGFAAGKSGREDLNLRPHGPEPCRLAKLSYAP